MRQAPNEFLLAPEAANARQVMDLYWLVFSDAWGMKTARRLWEKGGWMQDVEVHGGRAGSWPVTHWVDRDRSACVHFCSCTQVWYHTIHLGSWQEEWPASDGWRASVGVSMCLSVCAFVCVFVCVALTCRVMAVYISVGYFLSLFSSRHLFRFILVVRLISQTAGSRVCIGRRCKRKRKRMAFFCTVPSPPSDGRCRWRQPHDTTECRHNDDQKTKKNGIRQQQKWDTEKRKETHGRKP